MAEAATLARPYAKAAFLSARDAKTLSAWSVALQEGSALAADVGIAEVLTDPKLVTDQIVAMFAGLGGGEIDAHWQNFVRLLTENKRLDVLGEISGQYELLRAQYENELDVQVTSAVEMTSDQQAKLTAALKTRFRCDVRMTTSVDPTLLGGAVVRAGDLVIDGSIQGRLQRMASELGG